MRLYTAALTDGWTGDELRRLGLAEPEKKARVQGRAQSRRGSNGGQGDTATAATTPTELS